MLHNNSRADLKRLRHTAAHGRALQHDIAKAEDLAHSNALLKRRNAELAAACAEAHRVLLDGRYAKRRSEMRKELEAMENKIRAKDAQTEALLKELKGGRAPLVQTRDRLLRKMEVLDHTKKPLLDKTAQDLRVEIDVLVQGRVQFESAEQQLASEIMPLLNERLQDEQMRRDTFSEHSKHTKQAIANAQTQIKAARLRIATTEDRQASMQQAAQDALKVLAEEKEHVTSLRLELRYVQAPNISGVHPGGKSQSPSQSPTSSSGTVSMVRGHHRRTSSVRASKEAALASQLHKEKIEAERLRHELAALKTESASAESGAKAAEEKAKQEGSARTSAELLVVRRQVREVRSAISQERAKLSVVERNNAAADVKLSRLAAEEKRMRSADKTNTGTSKRLAEEQDLLEKRAMALESKMEAARCHVGALSDAIARQETLLGVVRGDLNRERHDIGAKLRSKVNQLSSTIQSLEKSTPPREHQIAECRVAIAQLQQQQKILHDKIDKAREAHSSMTDRLDEADVRFRESKRAYDSDRSAALVEAQTRSQTQKEMRALVASCDDKVATLSEEVRLAHEALRQLEREHSLNETLLGKKQREIEFAKLAAERQREHEQSNRDKFSS
jgi:chromosome segregation ATPase